MVSDRNDARDRYSHQHAKFIVVDDRLLLVSSENFNPDSMPDDDKSDGTLGRRGTALVVDDPVLVGHARALFEADLDPAHHADLFRWDAADPRYGAPPAGFVPTTISGGAGYQLVHPQPLRTTGAFTAEFVQSPETSLLPPDVGGLLGMVARAGPGDAVLAQQLYERANWGGAAATPETAPNPRLLAVVEAARRGATVRILLDSFFDPGSNAQAAAYLNLLAQAERLDLIARLGNPAGRGLHNKMVLVQAGGVGWVHVGSLNGSEASSKINRELALQVQSNAVYDYLATAFWQDWLLAAPPR
jgi:phosphatidylserine/phosphatidylglycerophosphate/cardiolipin synthase-like enzyme